MGLRGSQHHHPLAQGFTLVEVLMALLVMTVGLLGLLQSVNVAYEHSTRNRLREEALLVGEQQMNMFRIMTANSNVNYSSTETIERIIAGMPKKFSVTRENLLMGGTRRLKVTVGWSFKNVSMMHALYTLKKL